MINSKMDHKNTGLLEILYSLRAELDVYCLITINANSINKKGAGKSFWGFLQIECIHSIALSICKIFECEKQNKQGKVQHELNSIDGVLKCMSSENLSAKQSSRINDFIEKYNGLNICDSLSSLSSCIAGFKKKYQDELERFKTYRNKVVAHSEYVATQKELESQTGLPLYDVMERLFNFGADFYMLVSAAFVGVGPWDLSSNRKVKVGLKKVLQKFGLTELKQKWNE